MEKEKILVVDDTPHLRLLVRKFLEKAEFQVVEASDGAQALRFVQLETDLKLIFLDLMMPNLSGIEFLKKIAPLKQEMKLKICVMTAKELPQDIKECLKLGADDYIVKPIDGLILVDKAKILLGHKDANDFCSVKILNPGSIDLTEGQIDIVIQSISESSILFTSKLQLPIGAKIYIRSERLQQILGTDKPILLNLYASDKQGLDFNNAATFIALKDNAYQMIRSITTRGESQ